MPTKTIKSKVKRPTKIFTMTVVSGDPAVPLNQNEKRLRCRCWGYYFDRRTAAKAIENNWTDMSEMGYYRYGVLASLGEGPLPSQKELQWYEFVWDWNVSPRETDGIVIPEFVEARKIDKPEKYQQVLFGGF